MLLAMLATACGGGGRSSSDSLDVVVTTSVWGDVVSEIVGDDAVVEVLIPRGADAHDYQPTPQQVARIGEADLVVSNGLGLEEGLADLLETAEGDGANVLELASQLDPIAFAEHEEHGEHEEEEGPEHGDLDPHVWFDPTRVASASVLIAESLTAIDDTVDWPARAAAYSKSLTEANLEISLLLDPVTPDSRKLVTNHDSLGYFARAYDFEVVGVVIPGGSTLGDPSSSELAALVDVINTENVSAIFTETSQSSDLAEAVAAEVGHEIEIVELYTESLGPADGPAGTLIGMLTENARRIGSALS
ncbi:MAG TPA: metal ABC transporter substrate-binding protein [Acidimicrobiia bacterium]|nr:metal ABC transporter substrate-binding protein [Acidimicrobiia bacterium]